MSWEERQLIEKEIEGLLKAGECGLASNNEKYQWTNTSNAIKHCLQQRDLYENTIVEIRKLILEKFNKDNYLSCGRVARILSVLDKANIKEND